MGLEEDAGLRAAPTIAVVCLTMGTRPDDLARGLASLAAQRGVSLDIVVVGNGWMPVGLPAGVRALGLPENLGIPAGRNRGVSEVVGEYLFFLDDDANIPSPTFLADAVAVLGGDPTIGMLQPRVTDPSGVGDPTRWIPRIRKGDPAGAGQPALTAFVRRNGGWFPGGAAPDLQPPRSGR